MELARCLSSISSNPKTEAVLSSETSLNFELQSLISWNSAFLMTEVGKKLKHNTSISWTVTPLSLVKFADVLKEVRSCGIYNGHSSLGASFPRLLLFFLSFLIQLTAPQSSIIRDWYYTASNDQRIKWTQSHKQQRRKQDSLAWLLLGCLLCIYSSTVNIKRVSPLPQVTVKFYWTMSSHISGCSTLKWTLYNIETTSRLFCGSIPCQV